MSKRRIAVIGGGVIGYSCAVKLASRGHSVDLFDDGSPTAASWAANGAITPYSDHNESQLVTSFAEWSASLYPEYLSTLSSLTGVEVDHDYGGVYELYFQEDVELAHERASSMLRMAYDVEVLSRNSTLRAIPSAGRQVQGSIWYRSEFRIDIVQLLRQLEAAAGALGVDIHSPMRVRRIALDASSSVRVDADDRTATFDVAVVATGAGNCEIADLAPISIDRIRGELLEVLGQPDLVPHCVFRGDSFITPRRDGRLLLGTSYDVHVAGMDESTDSVSVVGAVTKLAAALEMVPAIASCELKNVWKSWRPTTTDGLPRIGPYGSPEIIVALGLGGLGFTLAPSTAEVVCHYVEQSRPPDRFSEFTPV